MQARPGFKWTQEELDVLRMGAVQGKSWDEIAKEVGRTKEAVSTKARELGLTEAERIRLWTEEEDATLTQMRAEGAMNKEIGVVLGRNTGAVEKRVKVLGLRKRSSIPLLPETKAETEVKAWFPSNDGLELVRLWQAANQRVGSRAAERKAG